ncbi:Histone-lysine N-methyltransferase setd3 [Acipenser ruthenus]|uniref:protein-histidine N-methyltransferase n=1 Tax=Acipenser ruthenus TaxID=7906 RepID=A0A444V6U2_ACIRT|nr:Histone-lysine N-methyltransferase setd3 [Acipenser ruthenus]
MMNIISELLQKCSSPAPAPGKEWEEYVQIRSLVERIRKKQKGLSVIFDGTREDFFPELMAWAAENGASTEGFEIANFPEEGFGLKATRDIKAEELFLWIPRNMLMTVESAKNSVLVTHREDFDLWAVSSVMTRQNQIPTEDGNRVTLALIPLWDMCNHTNGLIYIFYGTRSNAEFVIHNGFFFDNNSHDRVKIKLGVSKSERLYAMKAEVLARAGIPSSSIFALHCSEPPISAQLLAFLRVFCMSEDELKEYLVGEHAIDKIFTLGNAEFPVSWDNEIKLWTFLETRAALLLKTYKTTSEADRSLLEKPDLSFHFKIAIKLRLAEKEILEKAVASGQAKREYFQKKLEEGAPLPKYEESNISMLENSVSDSKLPIILGKLEEADETGEQELKMTEALSKVNAGGDVLVNGDSKQLSGTNTENEETLHREENAMKTDDAKENVEEITECNKVAEGQS